MQNLLEIKNKLKELKKQLSSLFIKCEKQLVLYEELAAKTSTIKMGYYEGMGLGSFNKVTIDSILSLVQKSVKFTKELEQLKLLIKNQWDSSPMPNVSLTGYKEYGYGFEVSNATDNEAIKFLERESTCILEENIGNLLEEFIINNNLGAIYKATNIYINYYTFLWVLDQYIRDITMLINAIDNDKIKMPINDIGMFYSILIILGINEDKINNILGMAINYNNKYALKNTNNKIKNIDLIKKLSKYYNQDGTFKSNLSIEEFNSLLLFIKDSGSNYFEILKELYFLLFSITNFTYNIDFNRYESTIGYIKDLYLKHKDCAAIEVKKEVIKILKYKNTIDRDFYKYLDTIYDSKNDLIIAIPDNLEEFYQRLFDSNLTSSRKKHIRKLLKDSINKTKQINSVKYLTIEEFTIYERAIYLVDNLDFSNPDKWELNRILKEIQDILDILNTDISNEDKEELLQELSKYIEELLLISSRNTSSYVKKLKI